MAHTDGYPLRKCSGGRRALGAESGHDSPGGINIKRDELKEESCVGLDLAFLEPNSHGEETVVWFQITVALSSKPGQKVG